MFGIIFVLIFLYNVFLVDFNKRLYKNRDFILVCLNVVDFCVFYIYMMRNLFLVSGI